jgi:NAD(P)-dependent dehydrogenase (short-subunit alcohol dehydrogenase family)
VKWSARDIPDRTGTVALVTGVTGGLGFHTALELARSGTEVILAGRDQYAVHEVADLVKQQVPAAAVPAVHLDLADLSSVRDTAELVLERWPRIDLLVNNAGVMATPPHLRTADGFDLQLGTNHLGHFALTGQLFPALQSARVVTVSSFMHNNVSAVGDVDPRSGRRRRKWRQYSESKLANLLFMLELHRRAWAAGLDLVSVGAHPGHASTNLAISGPQLGAPDLASYLLIRLTRVFGQSAAKGALPILMAATLRTIAGGTYIGPSGFLELRGAPEPVGMSKAARDEQAAADLWVRSEEVTGVRFLSGPV